ncbi:unnamed protein product, partial [Didymodactylos carnosus]
MDFHDDTNNKIYKCSLEANLPTINTLGKFKFDNTNNLTLSIVLKQFLSSDIVNSISTIPLLGTIIDHCSLEQFDIDVKYQSDEDGEQPANWVISAGTFIVTVANNITAEIGKIRLDNMKLLINYTKDQLPLAWEFEIEATVKFPATSLNTVTATLKLNNQKDDVLNYLLSGCLVSSSDKIKVNETLTLFVQSNEGQSLDTDPVLHN